jgi:hypothetical protein
MVYQFLGEEDAERAQMTYVGNPYKGKVLPVPEAAPPGSAVLPPAAAPTMAETPPPLAPTEPVVDPITLAQSAPDSGLANSPVGGPPLSSLDYIKAIPNTEGATMPRAHSRAPMRRERALKKSDPPIPPGFVKTVTRHFNVYAEGDPASAQFIQILENLHGNLMLDLAAFAPWSAEDRVAVFLFKSQDTYRQVTGRPAWSGGASSVPNRKVYVYESEELPGILAHELTHIYYDGFYLSGATDPLWLSEGMATLVQVERGLAAPTWLRENLEILERGGGFTMAEMMSVTTTADSPDDKVRLWYAQAYSTVRFLIRAQYKSNFYKFSDYLREGKDPTQALYRAYGMPYNRLKALEYAWRYELASNSLSRLSQDR